MPLLPLRKPDIHQNHIRLMCGSLCDRSSGRRRCRTNIVAQLNHERREIHGDKCLIFDDEHLHGYRVAGRGTVISII